MFMWNQDTNHLLPNTWMSEDVDARIAAARWWCTNNLHINSTTMGGSPADGKQKAPNTGRPRISYRIDSS